jgi:hypothetical protein
MGNEDNPNPAEFVVEDKLSRRPKRRMYRLARAFYHSIPGPLRAIGQPLALHSQLLKRLRPEVWIIEGHEQKSQLPLSVCLYVTTNEYKRYLENLIFGSSFRARYIGQTWLWNAFRQTPKGAASCSMTIAEVHDRHLKWMGSGAGIVIPAWIQGTMQLPRGPEQMNRDSIKAVLRKIMKQGMEYEVTRDPKSFDDFYQNIYVPHTTRRHGDRVHLSSREKVWALFEKGELIMVKRRGAYIAGKLISYKRGIPHMTHMGVRDGRMDLIEEGAIGAAYEFTFQHLENKGHREVHFGQSRGFLNDGVLQFKKKYGHRVVGKSDHKFLLKITSDKSATRAFLQNNPFIFEHLGELYGAAFLSDQLPDAQVLERLKKQLSQAGLAQLVVFSFLSGEAIPIDEIAPTPPPNRPGSGTYEHLSQVNGQSLIGRLGNIAIDEVIAIHSA